MGQNSRQDKGPKHRTTPSPSLSTPASPIAPWMPWAAGVLVAGALLWIVTALPAIFAGQRQVDPVLVEIGPFQLRWYGVLIAFSFVPGYLMAAAEAHRKGFDYEKLLDFAVFAAILGLIGARLGYVVQNLDYFLANPVRILAAWEGGLSLHGVLAGGLLAAWAFTRRERIPILPFLDVTVPSLLLGQVIGRWGNFFNQELFGYPTDVPWAMFVRPENRPAPFLDRAFYHPTFLYESLWNAGALAFLLWYRRRPYAREGDVFFLYLVVYSAGRFWVEFFRIGSKFSHGLTLAQWVSLLLIAAGGGLLLLHRRRPLKAHFRFPQP